MRIRYVGGRSQYTITFNRKKFYFTKENDSTIEVTDQKLANYIGRLTNNSQFEFVVESQKEVTSEADLEAAPEKKKSGKSKKGGK